MDENKNKVELIREIQRVCETYDRSVTSEAVECLRHPDDEDKRNRARNTLARADALQYAQNQIIPLVHKYWPKETP